MSFHYSHSVQKTVIQKLENRAVRHNFVRIIVEKGMCNLPSNELIIRQLNYSHPSGFCHTRFFSSQSDEIHKTACWRMGQAGNFAMSKIKIQSYEKNVFVFDCHDGHTYEKDIFAASVFRACFSLVVT